MSVLTTSPNTPQEAEIYYEDYGTGSPVILIHGWPLSSAMWEYQVPALVEAGHRVIAYDRRGFGKSSRPWSGYDYNTLTSDLHTLIESLDLRDVTLVGFSMGGGEAVRYIAEYGQERISKLVLMASVTPYLVKTEDNPDGVDPEIIAMMKSQVSTNRLPFLAGFTKQFVNWSTIGSNAISHEGLDASYLIGSLASPRATLECIGSFAETDFREDLAKVTVPTLVMHGDADKVVPFENSGARVQALLPHAVVEVISGGAHGLPATNLAEVNELLVEFCK